MFSLKSWVRQLRASLRTPRTGPRRRPARLALRSGQTGSFVLEDRLVPSGAANDHTVLILGSTVTGGASSREAQAAVANGMTVEVASDAAWLAKTQAEFATYRALILGDPTCAGSTAPITAATSDKNVWGPVVNGNVIINGSDPVFHAPSRTGAVTLTNNSVAFAVDKPGKTGMYISLSCYYFNASPGTPVPLLDAFGPGAFKVRQTNADSIHVVATHPALSGLTDSTLSNWGNSTHEAFDNFAPDFAPLAIAVGFGGYVAPDGTVGNPYVIARGVTVLSDINLQSDTHDTHALGSTHSFTATVTKDSPAPGTPVVGTTVTFSVVSGPNVGRTGTGVTDAAGKATFSYTSSAAGVDLVKASFVDSAGRTQSSGNMQVTWLANQAPTADAGGIYDVNEGGTVTLHGAGTDPEGGVLTYAWDLDEDGSFETSGKDPTFSAADLDGNYLDSHVHVKLRVTDDAGNSTESGGIVFIHNLAPTATLSNDGPVTYGQTATVSFGDQADASAADTEAGFTYAYSLDGTSFSTPGVESSAPYNLNAGAYTIFGRIYDKDGDYSQYSTSVTVDKAAPTVTVAPVSVTYDGAAHGTTGTVTGVGGILLGDPKISYSSPKAPVNAGTYTASGSFGGNENYLPAIGTATIDIAKANAEVVVIGYAGVYDGAAHGASGSATGVDGVSLMGLDLGATFTDVPGGTAHWTFTDATGNYKDASGSVEIAITKATPTVAAAPVSATYDGSAHGTTGSVTGVSGASLGSAALTYDTADGAAPVNAGSYIATGSFAGDGNYLPATGTAVIAIAKADASVSVSAYAGTYDALPHGVAGAATGVGGADLGGLLHLGGSYTDAGHYDVGWSFDGNGNYNATSGSSTVDITKATPTVHVIGGTFVYDGAGHPATGSVTGVGGANLGTPSFTYTDDETGVAVSVPVEPGYYTVRASFGGSPNYVPAMATAKITVVFEVRTLTDLSRAFNAGRTIPIKIQLIDANGHNLSSAGIDVTALRLDRINADGTRTQVALQDAGAANPDNLFRYDAGLQGYIFNLSTRGLTAGNYVFSWTSEGDPTVHELTFRLV